MNRYDVCILGAGLAGMHTAIELHEAGLSVCVVDPKSVAGGASETPVGLANPATGRFANRSWEAERCLEKLTARLEQISTSTGQKFYRNSGVLRPALSEKIAGRMRENVIQNEWTTGMVEWKSSAEIEGMHPGLTSVEGGVWVPVGLTVLIPDYLHAMHSFLKQHAVDFMLGSEYSYHSKNDLWEIHFDDQNSIAAHRIVVCAGIYSKNIECSKHLPFHAVKGQTALLKSDQPISFDHAVSAQGYFSKTDKNEFVLGSTYEHNFEHENPDEQGKEFMLNRFKNVHPKLAASSQVISQWAGVRASTPDRKPIIGRIPTKKNLFVFAGLGSKGLLYSAYGAGLLKDFMLNDHPVPKEVSVERFKP